MMCSVWKSWLTVSAFRRTDRSCPTPLSNTSTPPGLLTQSDDIKEGSFVLLKKARENLKTEFTG